MGYWDIEMRHIVDVDGQLLAIDSETINASSLLAKANRAPESRLYEVRAGEYFLLQPGQDIRLVQDEVRFFETPVGFRRHVPRLLAA